MTSPARALCRALGRHLRRDPQHVRAFHAARPALALTDNLPDSVALPDGATLQRPKEPEPHECCGRGCEFCVWTIYWQDLKDFQAAVARSKGSLGPQQLDPFEEFEKKLQSNK